MITMILISMVVGNPVMGQAGADLEVTPSDISFSNENPASGEVITIEATVHNLGPSVATNVVVEWFVAAAPLIPPTKTISTIQPASTGTATHQWVAPIPGSYTIRIQVSGDQSDPDPNNNEAQRNITVGTVVPTINVTAEPSSDTLESKQAFIVNGTATMNGEPVNSGNVKVEIIQTGVSNENTTAADGTFSVAMIAPVDQSNEYEVKVTVTQDPVIGETQFMITVLQPDLMVTTLTFNGKSADEVKAKAGENVKVKVGFQNIGNGTAHNVVFQLMIDNQIATTKDKLGDFAAGKTYSVTYVWEAKKGTHDFQAILDPDDTIEEISESNNKKADTLDVKEKDEPSPSFEMVIFIFAIMVIFLFMRNGNGRQR